jgi:hypothetical protein
MLKNFKIKKLTGKALAGIIAYVIFKWTIIILFGSYLYRHDLLHPAYFLAFPVLALTVFYFKRRRKRRAGAAE